MSSSHWHAYIHQFEGINHDVILAKTLLCNLADLIDPASRRGIRHPFKRITGIIICAVIAGAKMLVEVAEWAQDVASKHLAG